MTQHATSLKNLAKKRIAAIPPTSDALYLIQDKLILNEQVRITKEKLNTIKRKLETASPEEKEKLQDEMNVVMKEFHELNALIKDHLQLLQIPELS